MARKPSLSRASKAYEDFTGAKPAKLKKTKLDNRDVSGWQMGPMVGAAYEATRDGKTQRYFHEFKKSARPNLVARDDGRQLYIEGGRYKVTDRGIEDMPQLFTVNPSARKGRKARPMARRRRTASRRRATRQVAVFRANPVRRRRRRTTTRRYARNPVRRAAFARNPVRRRRRHTVRRSYRRNPSARRMGGGAINVGKMLFPAVGIGLGAVGTELLMGWLPIPPNFKVGVMRHVTKGVIGVAAGMLLGKVLKMKRLGNFFALGAVAIATHDAVKEMIASRMPSLQMGQYTRGFGSPVAGGHRLGYMSPAGVTRLGQYGSAIHGTVAALGGSHVTTGVGGEMDFAA